MKRPGSSPGQLLHVGKVYVDKPQVSVHRYDVDSSEEFAYVDELPEISTSGTTWLQINGVHDVELMARVGEKYGISSLEMEDVLNTRSRPKFSPTAQGGFMILRMLRWIDGAIDSEQVSVWWKPGILILWQEKPGDVFEPIRDRIRDGSGRIRKRPANYLAYALADAVVDHLTIVTTSCRESMDAIEEELVNDWQAVSLEEIHIARRQSALIRRAVSPLREAIVAMRNAPGMGEEMAPFVGDLQEHIWLALDATDQHREHAAALRDLYQNAQAQHMNRVMQTLTVVATIFIPLTFFAGIYGMNFSHMPELGYKWSYPIFITANVTLGIGLLALFKRKGWM